MPLSAPRSTTPAPIARTGQTVAARVVVRAATVVSQQFLTAPAAPDPDRAAAQSVGVAVGPPGEETTFGLVIAERALFHTGFEQEVHGFADGA